jgi:predicted nucleotidyltransferase
MAQTRRQITTLIRRYIAALEARGIPVERVILFGSHASGHPDEWSDIDIAVISPKFDTLSLLERYEQLGLANRDRHAPLDVVGNSVRLNFCMAVVLSDTSSQYERSIPFLWPSH